MSKNDILFVRQLRESGIGTDTYRVLKKHTTSSPCLGCELRDVYNNFAQIEYRRFDGGDADVKPKEGIEEREEKGRTRENRGRTV